MAKIEMFRAKALYKPIKPYIDRKEKEPHY